MERAKCIGCGYCALLCPEHFTMDEDGKALLKGGSKKDDLQIKETFFSEELENAVLACPTQCIKKENLKRNGGS